jgi:hypothetical protein
LERTPVAVDDSFRDFETVNGEGRDHVVLLTDEES